MLANAIRSLLGPKLGQSSLPWLVVSRRRLVPLVSTSQMSNWPSRLEAKATVLWSGESAGCSSTYESLVSRTGAAVPPAQYMTSPSVSLEPPVAGVWVIQTSAEPAALGSSALLSARAAGSTLAWVDPLASVGLPPPAYASRSP
ncbi:hypothetical protein [Fodinicola feengrottensis]|uniref:hypothetical protein n=1 Tax=Fodinicola feengrottensis TaxID=435914 RepID=UPI002442BC24|nr:hypothetical protein [Fodinicola feengrottensis]